MSAVWRMIIAVLRELSDEAPYRRHLDRRGEAHSGQAWRRFSEERLKAKYQRARCC